MPMTVGQMYSLMYGGKNTDVVSLYLSTMSASTGADDTRASLQAKRLLADEIKYLTKEQARYKRELQDLRVAGGNKEQLYKTLRAYRGEQERLLRAQAQYERQLISLKSGGLRQKITVAELKQKEEEKISKLYTLPSTARRELQAIIKDAEYAMSGGNALSNMTDLLRGKNVFPGLPEEQQKVYAQELFVQLENLRRNKEVALGTAPIETTDLESIILDAIPLEYIPEAVDIQEEVQERTAQQLERFEGLADDLVFEPGEEGSAKNRILSQVRKVAREIRKTEGEIGETQIDRAEELLADMSLEAYLADVRDDSIVNQSLGEYDIAAADEARIELQQIAEAEPLLIDIETQQLLDPDYVERELALSTARRERYSPTAPQAAADPMSMLLQAPRVTGFSPLGDVQTFISDLQDGTKRSELTAQFIAQQNPDTAYAKAWQAADPSQRVLLALLPEAIKRSKGELTPKGLAEKKAQQAINVAGGAKNLDASNIMRLASEQFKTDKAEQRAFARFILSAQRAGETLPAELDTEMSSSIEKERKAALEALAPPLPPPLPPSPTEQTLSTPFDLPF